MNRQEARRYAHLVAAGIVAERAVELEALMQYRDSADGRLIIASLRMLAEQHDRYRPKSTDHAPKLREPISTPLLDMIDAQPEGVVST